MPARGSSHGVLARVSPGRLMAGWQVGSTIAPHTRFLWALLLLLVGALILPYGVIRSDALYCRHSTVFWDATDCYKFGLTGQSSDIVFVGDSSLTFGVRPTLMAEADHLDAYNLGLSAGAVLFSPGLLLDDYLAHNRRPRIVVLYVGAWTLVEGQPDIEHLWADGARVAVRHGSVADMIRVFRQDPRRLIQLPVIVLQQGIRQFSLSENWWAWADTEMQSERGWFDIRRPRKPFTMLAPGQRPALERDCSMQAKPLAPPDRALIERFRAAYQTHGTRVLVYVAPVPACDPSYASIVRSYAGVSDNKPLTLPGPDFIDDGWRVHLNRAGAAEATAQVAAFLRPFIAAKHPATEAGSSVGASGMSVPPPVRNIHS